MIFNKEDQHICKECGTPYPEGDWRVLESYPVRFYHISCNPKPPNSAISEKEIAASPPSHDCAKDLEIGDPEDKEEDEKDKDDGVKEGGVHAQEKNNDDDQEEWKDKEDYDEEKDEVEEDEEDDEEEDEEEEDKEEDEDAEDFEDSEDAEDSEDSEDPEDSEDKGDLEDDNENELCTCGGQFIGSCVQQSSSYCRIYTTIMIIFLLILLAGRSEYQASNDYCIPDL